MNAELSRIWYDGRLHCSGQWKKRLGKLTAYRQVMNPEKAIVEDGKGNWAANNELQKEIVKFVLSRWSEFGWVSGRSGPGLAQCLLNRRLFGRLLGSWRWHTFQVLIKFGHSDAVMIHFRDLSLFGAHFFFKFSGNSSQLLYITLAVASNSLLLKSASVFKSRVVNSALAIQEYAWGSEWSRAIFLTSSSQPMQ